MRARDVMTSPVITVTPDASVPEIAELLLTRKVSGVPVVNGSGRVIGIVSEGDLLRRVETGTERARDRWLEMLLDRTAKAADFLKSHGRRAQDVMTRQVISAAPDTDLGDIADLMERNRIKRVPILEDGRPVGIVSRANLLHGLVAYKRTSWGAAVQGDAAIRNALLDELSGQDWIQLDQLNIVVTDGTVHLWGMVDSEEQRRALCALATGTPGVQRVEEHLHRNRFVG